MHTYAYKYEIKIKHFGNIQLVKIQTCLDKSEKHLYFNYNTLPYQRFRMNGWNKD